MTPVPTTKIAKIVGGTFVDRHGVEKPTDGVETMIEKAKNVFNCGIEGSDTAWFTYEDELWWKQKLKNILDPDWVQENRLDRLVAIVNWGGMPIPTEATPTQDETEDDFLRRNP